MGCERIKSGERFLKSRTRSYFDISPNVRDSVMEIYVSINRKC